jgi:hypothetical protein
MKTSNIFEENKIVKSNAFNSLSPKMKEVATEFYSMLDKENNSEGHYFEWSSYIENCVNLLVDKHNINKRELLGYFDKEVKEQLGIKEE